MKGFAQQKRERFTRSTEKTQKGPKNDSFFVLLVSVVCFLCTVPESGKARPYTGLPAYAQSPAPRKIWDGVFTTEQTRRGKAEYDQFCSRCHNVALIGSERGPAIKGSAFLSQWEKGTVNDLFIKIRDTMPEGGPGTLNEDVKVDILAYILQQNGYPEGADVMRKNSLDDIRMAKKGIWDGVFTTAQAERGKTALLQNGCNGCHGADLEGARGPSLKGERFITAWENGSVNRLFIKIRDTMPPLNAEQVSQATKVDIIAHLLAANGFPSGNSELALDVAALDGLQIVRKGAENLGAPNFALVQVFGCLTQNPSGRWVLTNSTAPNITKEESPAAEALKAGSNVPLGTETFALISVSPAFKADAHKGHKVEARGLLYKDPASAELNLTSLAMIAPSCQ
jgi:mono/diheme cytochrome c family protein